MSTSTRLFSGRARRVPALLATALLISACASGHGSYVWAADYVAATPSAADGEYLVGVGDLVQVQVWDNEKLSTRARVRSDGKISIPLLNDVDVAGKQPKQVARELEQLLRAQSLVNNPRVNVLVEEVEPVKITVLGAVAHAGTYAVDPGSGVAEALASAGGLTEFAHRDRIFVLRRTPTPTRIRFTFDAITETGHAAAFRLQRGDVVVAE